MEEEGRWDYLRPGCEHGKVYFCWVLVVVVQCVLDWLERSEMGEMYGNDSGLDRLC